MFKVNLEVKINIGEEFKAYKNLSFLDPENTEEASYEDTCFDTFDKNLSNLNKELIIREEYNNGNKTTLLYGHQKSHASDEFYPEYEIEIDNPENMIEIFKKLGYFEYKKFTRKEMSFRVTYRLYRVNINFTKTNQNNFVFC